jgi:hypothetical protein
VTTALALSLLALVLAAAAGACGGLSLLHARRRRTGLQLGETYIVNTARPDDQSIRGVLVRELPSGAIMLAAAAYLDADGTETAIAGDVVLPAFSWAQRVEPQAHRPADAAPVRPPAPRLPSTARPAALRPAPEPEPDDAIATV